MIGDGIQEAVKAAQSTAQIILPPTAPALPEEVAWDMIRMEGGAMAFLLAIAVTVLWRLVSKILRETRAQNKELMDAQLKSISELASAVQRVESAVRISDLNNQNAIGRLSETVNATIARLDKHELKIEAHQESLMAHSSRISILESIRTTPSKL